MSFRWRKEKGKREGWKRRRQFREKEEIGKKG